MPKVEKEEEVPVPEIFSHSIERSGGAAKIRMYGRLPKDTWIMKTSVESGSWDVENNTMDRYSENSGIPVAEWKDGSCTMDYPVPNPTLARKIIFKFKVKLNDGRISLFPVERVVDYTIQVGSNPGFQVTSGGTFDDLAGNRLMGSAGMLGHYDPGAGGTTLIIPSSSTAVLRVGLHGILLD